MPKAGICILTAALVLLCGCSAGGARLSDGEQLALQVRGSYLAMEACTATAKVTADYGRRVYQYELDYALTEGESVITLTAPDTVAGIVARVGAGESLLEYDSLVLETGDLDNEGLTPLSAIPVLLEQSRSGYIKTSHLEDWQGQSVLRIDCGDPEGQPGQGRQVSVWFDTQSHAMLQGEISVDGYRVIFCEFTAFSPG